MGTGYEGRVEGNITFGRAKISTLRKEDWGLMNGFSYFRTEFWFTGLFAGFWTLASRVPTYGAGTGRVRS